MAGDNGEGHLDELDESETVDREEDVRVLVDDEGNEIECLLLAVLELDGSQFALLSPLDELDGEDEEMEVYVFAYGEDDSGVEHFSEIGDEDTYNAVVAYASTLMETAPAPEN